MGGAGAPGVSGSPASSRRGAALAAASLVVALALIGAPFAVTVQRHVAVVDASAAQAAPVEYAVADDGDVLAATVVVENPTRATVEVAVPNVDAYLDGDHVGSSRGTAFEPVEVPAGETVYVTVRIPLDDEAGVGALERAIADGDVSVRGSLEGRIAAESFRIQVVEGGADDRSEPSDEGDRSSTRRRSAVAVGRWDG